MSERELFPSDHFEYISLRVVMSKNCELLTFDDYEKLDTILPHMFFTR